MSVSSLLSQKTFGAAFFPRYVEIEVTYLDIEGRALSKRLRGFVSKVSQHEFDHLQGVCNIYKKEAQVKYFDSKEASKEFLKTVQDEDKILYIRPH